MLRRKLEKGKSQMRFQKAMQQPRLDQHSNNLKETSQERRLIKYQDYLQKWDDYEEGVENYFKAKDKQNA